MRGHIGIAAAAAVVCLVGLSFAPHAAAELQWVEWGTNDGTKATGTFSSGHTVTLEGNFTGISNGAPPGVEYTSDPSVPGRPDNTNPPFQRMISGPPNTALNANTQVALLDLRSLPADAEIVFGLADQRSGARYRLELRDFDSAALPLTGVVVTPYDITYSNDIGFGGNNVADYNSTLIGDTFFIDGAHNAGGIYTHSGLTTVSNLPSGTRFIVLSFPGPGVQNTEGIQIYLGADLRFPSALGSEAVSVGPAGALAVYRYQAGSIIVELRNKVTGAYIDALSFFDNGFTPLDFRSLSDADGDGTEEIAVLAARNSDGRPVVEIRNVAGSPAPRQIWFAPDHTPVALGVIEADADNNGVPELVVLSVRDSDGRGLAEVKNAFGAENPVALWAAPGRTPNDLRVFDDVDGNSVPDIAIFSTRDSDGRAVAELKNAAGPTLPNTVWFRLGTTLVDAATIADADNDGTPEVVALLTRNSDGRILAEVRDASGPTTPTVIWYPPNYTAISVAGIDDADGNNVPEVAVLAKRNSDGRYVAIVANAVGTPLPRTLWQSPGNTALSVSGLADTDVNGIPEAAVLNIRDIDGRLLIDIRNAAGVQNRRVIYLQP